MRDLIKYLRLVLTGHDCQFKIIKRKYLTFKLVVTRGKTQVIMLAYCRNKYNVLTAPVIKSTSVGYLNINLSLSCWL